MDISNHPSIHPKIHPTIPISTSSTSSTSTSRKYTLLLYYILIIYGKEVIIKRKKREICSWRLRWRLNHHIFNFQPAMDGPIIFGIYNIYRFQKTSFAPGGRIYTLPSSEPSSSFPGNKCSSFICTIIFSVSITLILLVFPFLA